MKTVRTATPGRDEARIRSMFDRVAGRYDAMNAIMTAGMHRRWRQRCVDLAGVGAGDAAIDVCCGTGDLALELAERVGPDGRVAGTDFSVAMLALAREKARARGLTVEWHEADTLDLPFADDAFDACTVGFGVRNLSDLDQGFAEMARVVKPGGRVVCLEITTPKPPLSWFFDVWFDRLVPRLGAIAGHGDAYTYLPWSVKHFPAAPELAARMAGAGLEQVRYELLGGTAIAIHHGVVRSPAE